MAEEYVVRGAKTRCDFGSASVAINLPASHGSYINQKPQMNKLDKVPVVNVGLYGTCTAQGEPKPCTCAIPGYWLETNENCLIDGSPALTTNSKLVCALGGIITFENSGQK